MIEPNNRFVCSACLHQSNEDTFDSSAANDSAYALYGLSAIQHDSAHSYLKRVLNATVAQCASNLSNSATHCGNVTVTGISLFMWLIVLTESVSALQKSSNHEQ